MTRDLPWRLSTWWSDLRHRLTALFRGRRLEEELEEELSLHLEMEEEALVRAGASAAEARRSARLSFGGVERAKEQCREAWGVAALHDLGRDLTLGLRLSLREKGLSLAAIVVLALGIGATTTVLAAAYTVLVAPLPYPSPERLVEIENRWRGEPDAWLSIPEFLDFRDELVGDGGVMEHLGVFYNGSVNLSGGGERPERVRGAAASAGLFPALGVEPAIGRTFLAEETLPGGDPVAVLGWDLWERRFGGGSRTLGERLTVNGETVTVVGVMPAGFRLPGDFAASSTEVILPVVADPAERSQRGGHFLESVGRLAPGVSVREADAAVASTAAAFVDRYSDSYPKAMRFTAGVEPLHRDVVAASRPALLLLSAASLLTLIVACANVAGLLLARTRRRRREMGVRMALGASRGRLVRQLAAEVAVLVGGGGLTGLLLAGFATRLLALNPPPDLPRIGEIALSPPVVGVSALLVLGGVMLIAVLPALHCARTAPGPALQSGTARAVGRGPGEQRSAGLLVAGEVALALLLLVGAGLLGRSLHNLAGVDPGLEPAGVLAMDLSLSSQTRSPEEVVADYRQLLDRLAAHPAVEAAGAVSSLPLDSARGDVDFEIAGRPVGPDDDSPSADWQVVTPGYFDTVDMRLAKGRFLSPADRFDAPGAAVINRTLERTYWPRTSALGERLHLDGGTRPSTVTVVGVVEDVKNLGLDAAPQKEIFLAHPQFRFWNNPVAASAMTLTLRGADAQEIRRLVEEEVHALDPTLPVSNFRTLAEVVGAATAEERFLVALVSLFSVLTLIVASVGIYGLLAYSVERRRGEIGIRRALGAPSRTLLASVLRRGLRPVAVGVTAGLAVAWLAGHLIQKLLFGVPPHDPITLVAAPLVLLLVSALAASIPAVRALRTDPARVLRAE